MDFPSLYCRLQHPG